MSAATRCGKMKRSLLIVSFSFLITQIFFIATPNSHMMNKQQLHKIPEPIDDQSEGGNKHHRVNRFYKSEGFPPRPLPVDDVTINMHGSIDRLHHLVALIEKWPGPISYAIFAPGRDASHADDVIDGLRMCWTEVRHRVAFHLVYPADDVADMSEAGSFVYLACKDVIRRLHKMTSSSASKYPHNLMRNVARSGALTRFVLDLDGDVLPSRKLRENFRKVVERKREESGNDDVKNVYVIPIFEVKEETENLQEFFQDQNSRPYLYETCPSCHEATNYDRWLQMSDYNRPQDVATYQVEKATGWEPFFIIAKDSRDYDVAMTNYGFDRLAYVCALRANAYKFVVMTSSFLYTRGYRSRLVAREEQLRRVRNEKRFMKTFYSYLIARGYPKQIDQVC